MTRKRMKPEARKEQIVEAALLLAEKQGFMNVTPTTVAAKVGLSHAAVNYHFKTKTQLQAAIVTAAIKQEFLPLIAQLVVVNDKRVRKLSPELKQKALLNSAG